MILFKPRHSAEYKSYLRSEQWRIVRKKALRGAGWRCEHCGKRPPEVPHLEVNHKHYRTRFGHEQWPRDLEALCPKCHRRADDARRARNRRPASRLRRAWGACVLAIMLLLCVGGIIVIAALVTR